MKVMVCLTDSNLPVPSSRGVAEAELVVLAHSGGLWSVWKEPSGRTLKRVAWDRLPRDIKQAIPVVVDVRRVKR